MIANEDFWILPLFNYFFNQIIKHQSCLRRLVSRLPFKPTIPHAADGRRIEPPPSEPNAIGHSPKNNKYLCRMLPINEVAEFYNREKN